MSKYWVLCLTHVSPLYLNLNIPKLSRNPVFVTFVVCTLRHIRGSLDHLTICTIAAALVSTRLANAILYGIPAKHISRPRCTQNTLTRIVTGKWYTDSSPSILKEPHWLPIDARIKFKIATLTFKALNTGNPPYLTSCSTGTPHAELYNLPQPICCLSHDVTCHLLLVVSVQLLLPSGIVSQLTSVLV